MNRRSFFKRTIGALASAYLAPLLPRVVAESGAFKAITFKGIPITANVHCDNTIYFLSNTGVWKLSGVVGPVRIDSAVKRAYHTNY